MKVAEAFNHGNNRNKSEAIGNKATFRYFDSGEAQFFDPGEDGYLFGNLDKLDNTQVE